MNPEESYAYCRRVSRQRAKNFYYSFLLLDKERRNAMCAVYAFMRRCDDLSDGPRSDRAAINQWRTELTGALEGRYSGHPVWPAFHNAVLKYEIPREYFFEMIEGVASDLEPRDIQSFDELYRYCYRVASVVGMTIIHIFGFKTEEAPRLAEKCGIAFQLTNIIRDVREDAGMGRVYLPAEDRRRFGVTSIESGEPLRALLQFEGQRAREYYRQSAPLLDLIHSESRASLWALIRIYSRLLERIEASNFDVLARRIRVPAWEKASIVARAYLM